MGIAYRVNHRGGSKVAAVTGFTAVAVGTGTIVVYWTPPAKDYSGIMVRYSVEAYPPTTSDGTLAGDGAGQSITLPGGAVVTGFSVSGLTAGTTYYFSGFSYKQSAGGTRRYSDSIAHASAQAQKVDPSPADYSGTSVEIPGIGLGLTGDGVYTVPAGIYALDVFCVGGGGGGGGACQSYSGNWFCGGGGGGGATTTALALAVTPGQQIPVTIGPGGAGGNQYIVTSEDMDGQAAGGGNGTNTYFGAIGAAGGAGGEGGATTYGGGNGGFGGCGGGGGGKNGNGITFGGDGGSNGANGTAAIDGGSHRQGGAGQGTTTTAFGGNVGSAYSGGGGGGWNGNGGVIGGGAGTAPGTGNTGGGGGGGTTGNGAAGGSGLVIIRAA